MPGEWDHLDSEPCKSPPAQHLAQRIGLPPKPPAPGSQGRVLVGLRRATRAGDLPEAHRLVNGDAWCSVGYQGSVSCVSGDNGFTLAWWGGVLEP